MMLLIALNILVSGVLMFVGICRLNHVTKATRPAIRHAYVALFAAGALCLIAPIAWSVPITLPQIVVESAVVLRLLADQRRPA